MDTNGDIELKMAPRITEQYSNNVLSELDSGSEYEDEYIYYDWIEAIQPLPVVLINGTISNNDNVDVSTLPIFDPSYIH